MRRIRIAQIGINRYSHGPELFSTLKSHPELFDLVGYVLVEDERETCAVNLEKYYGGYPELSLREVLEDPTIEAVTVETDEIHLLKYARMAAEHGKHIHMEKPGSQSLEDFEALIETMRKTGKVFHMGYMFRYHPLIADAIQRVKSGEFGRIYSVEAHMSRYDDRKCREWLDAFKGGMMFYLGSNLILRQLDAILGDQCPFTANDLNSVSVGSDKLPILHCVEVQCLLDAFAFCELQGSVLVVSHNPGHTDVVVD